MPETLYLIDGHAQIFRAYYAIRGGMRSPVTSEPTHAIFGMTGMILKLLSEFHPHYVAMPIDMPGRTFRDDLYDEYKATRSAAPDDFHQQIPRIMEVVQLFGIPIIGVPGLEADDVIATITQRILDNPDCSDVNVRIVSRDKDLEQLLGPRVTMFDIHTDSTIDVESLMANKGIRPEQVVDVLALTGDTIDNVPGVEGVGPKTAAKLIHEFGSIDGILENLANIKGRVGENLAKGRDQLALSRTLVTLKRDADFEFSLEAARVSPVDAARLIPLFQQLGFNKYLSEVRRLAAGPEASGAGHPSLFEPAPSSAPAPVTAQAAASGADTGSLAPAAMPVETEQAPERPFETASPGSYEAITTLDALESLVVTLRSQPMISIDTETNALGRNAALVGICLAWRTGHGVYIPTRSPSPDQHLDTETVIRVLRPVLEDPTTPKCGHNIKFDAGVLLRHGVKLRGVVFDSMLATQLFEPSHSSQLDQLALKWLHYQMIPISDLIGSGKEQITMDAVPLEAIVPYAAEDADITLRLWEKLSPEIDSRGMSELLRDVEAPLSVVLAEMESNGILCDPDELMRQGDLLGMRAGELRQRIQELCGCEFSLDSTKQLAEVLFDRLGLTPGKKTKSGASRSTDIEVLEKLAAQEDKNDPRSLVPALIIEYRMLQKLISTYLGNLRAAIDPQTGRIHSSFHQLVTATGRLASHGPNMQNIPVRTDIGRQIRKAFYAPEGCCLICADYSQIELRLLAHFSRDEGLVEAFAKDQDIHTAVAAQVFETPVEAVTREQRNNAKTINFGIIYGVTPFGLARRIEGLDVNGARKLIEDYRLRFPGINVFLQECVRQALEQGYVTTILGRRRAIPEVASGNANTRSLGERLAINSVVQGSAADLIKAAMVNVEKRIDGDRLPVKILLQIHDELVLEAPSDRAEEYAAVVQEEMERAMQLSVPLRADAGIGNDWMSAK